MRVTLPFFFALLIRSGGFLVLCGAAKAAHLKSLEIYFIDTEGGQSTLLITPKRESLLIDAGWAGAGLLSSRPGDPRRARDPNRIVAAARDAGIKQIDYLLITHFHPDHDGGVPELAQLIPIRHFIDHESLAPEAQSEADIREPYEAYLAIRNSGAHIEPKPGDRLPLADINAVVVSSAAATIGKALPGAGEANAVCQRAPLAAGDPENARSTGVVVEFGKFRFLDVGDLSGQPLFDLVCPKNLVGPVDVYLVAHHGGADIADPATFAAFNARVAMMNNGLTKGGALLTFQTLHQVANLEDVWQLHYSQSADDENFAPARIANLNESTAHWIKLSASKDGSFRVLNGRTGEWKNYPATRPTK